MPIQAVPLSPDTSCRIGSGAFPSSIKCSSLLGAADGTQSMQAEYSTIVMGCKNTIKPACTSPGLFTAGVFNSILNGMCNSLSGCYTSIFGGEANCVDCGCRYNTIVSGAGNKITRGSYSIRLQYEYCFNI